MFDSTKVHREDFANLFSYKAALWLGDKCNELLKLKDAGFIFFYNEEKIEINFKFTYGQDFMIGLKTSESCTEMWCGDTHEEVCGEWKCFQNYAKYFYENWQEGLQLDKDILDVNNRVYSPDKCKFVPVYINNLLIHQKNVSNGLPVGVYCLKKGPRMVNELKKPYTVEWKKKSLGTFSTAMEAHKVWQINKANHIEATIYQYAKEKWFDTEVACALMSRVWRLRNDAAQGLETLRL